MSELNERPLYINNLKQELSTAKPYEHNLPDERYVVDRHQCHMAAKFGGYLNIIKDHISYFIVNSRSCTNTELFLPPVSLNIVNSL